MPEPADELVLRLRQIVAATPSTEAELRSLAERAHELERALDDDLGASEARLGELSADPDSSIAEAAVLLRRVDALRPELDRVRAVLDNFEERARALRTKWLLNQASDRPPTGTRDP